MTWFKLCDFHKALCIFRIFKYSRYFICKAKSTILAAKQVSITHLFTTFRAFHCMHLHFIHLSFAYSILMLLALAVQRHLP